MMNRRSKSEALFHQAECWEPAVWQVTEELVESREWPTLSIGILTYNRRDRLRTTLDMILRGTPYPDLDVIVIDNGSADGTAEMVRTEFPEVRLEVMPANLGVSARNRFTQLAHGKYLFSYDDDSGPGAPST